MEFIGYTAAVLIGISLGLIGGGGSILTVPVLVYLFHINAQLATTYSLFIVGITSILGSLSYFRKNLVSIRTAIVFGLPSVAVVFFTRRLILPAIPDKLLQTGSFTLSKDVALLLLFAVLMILASYSMLKKRQESIAAENPDSNYALILFQGSITGLITGLIGAGGGFLIIPALVNFLKLPIKTAIGTSLLIIALNSLTGFAFSLPQPAIQWSFLLSISAVAAFGIFIGSFLSARIDGKKLKPAFGYFVLVMGLYILLKETLFK